MDNKKQDEQEQLIIRLNENRVQMKQLLDHCYKLLAQIDARRRIERGEDGFDDY